MRAMTKKALEEAFAGESMAHMKYLAFSEVAKKEGFPQIAKLFEAIAFAERVHATNHAKQLGLIKSTADNLQSAIDGEHFEVEEMYPAYSAVAKLQKEKGADRSFYYAIEAEKIHEELYNEALEQMQKGQDINPDEIYICPICGYTHFGKPEEERCPVCNLAVDKFVIY